MSRLPRVSEAEWEVMEVVWRRRSATAAQVVEDLARVQDWNHRTIRTLLRRLVDKGALDYAVDGHRYVYRPAVSRRQCVRREGRSFLNKVFGGDAASLLVHFVQEANISDEEIEQLERMLRRKKR